MNRIACLVMALSVLVAGCATPSIRSADTGLRYDGIYRSSRKASDDNWYYLRFYSDGTVIRVSSTGQPEDLRKWFSREHPGLSFGLVTIHGNHLSFSVTSEVGIVDHSGEIDGDQLHLDSYSHTNQHRGSNRYVFLKW